MEGALAYLITTLTYKSPTKTLAIIENGGGILRNVSSHIAVREEYRQILRHHGCLQILLKHLRSPSLTIVSNACGTLWNLSARCPEDQQALWDMGAVSMLRNLVHSKHKMISMGSSAALKNLLAARPNMMFLDSDKNSKSNMPTLQIRKQRALEAELDQNLAETCENVESPHGSPTEHRKNNTQTHVNGPKYIFSSDNNGGLYQLANNDHRRPLLRNYLQPRSSSGENSPLLQSKVHSPQRSVSRSGSQDSVGSVHSDISHDRTRIHNMLTKSSRLLERPVYSPEKQRDHVLHRFNNAESLRSPNTAPNSRIMQVMQEVLQVGLDPNAPETHSADNTPQMHRRPPGGSTGRADSVRKIPVLSQRHAFRGGATEVSSTSDPHSFSRHQNTDGLNNVHSQQQLDNSNLPFNLAQRMENLHVNQDEEEGVRSQDQPINYSLKYSAEPSAINSHNNIQSTSGMSPWPAAKVGNYMSGLAFTGTPKVSNIPQRVNNYDKKETVSAANNRPETKMNKSIESSEFGEVAQYSGYAETDLDNMDQPTNYSIRYAEQVDDNVYTDQPINYSTRFQEPESNCHDCRLEDARRTNEILEHAMMTVNDDSVKTFCTEGTPLNFLSTATSMTDLSGKATNNKGSKSSENEESGSGHSNEKLHGFSKEHDRSGSSSIGSSQSSGEKAADTTVLEMDKMNDNVAPATPKPGPALNNNNNNTLPGVTRPPPGVGPVSGYVDGGQDSPGGSEKPTTYCEEGTPVCFSRVSSLSSLHSILDDQDPHHHQQQQPRSALKSTVDKAPSSGGAGYQRFIQPAALSDSPQSQSTEGGSTGQPAKSVTFDEHVEETPLMFSRCSSLGSLSSFDAHSVHSSVVSEYSRRASEVVSPSDLPDSPSETMPSSPKSAAKSPAKFSQMQTPKQQSTQSVAESACNTNTKTVVPSSVNLTSQDASLLPVPLPDPAMQFKDSPVAYAVEGSPDNFSCATSLSALTIDDEPKVNLEPILKSVVAKVSDNKMAASPMRSQAAAPRKLEPAIPEEEPGHSSVSEGEEDMLLKCISSAMPSRSAKKMKKSASDNAIKKKNAKSNNVTSLPSAVSTPNQNAAITSRPSGIVAPTVNSALSAQHRLPTFPPLTSHHDYLNMQDTIKSFATEGTPLNFSTATSLSDLSCISPPSESHNITEQACVGRDVATKKGKFEVTEADISDSSSMCEDTEHLLSEAIQMAMPKKSASKSHRRSSSAVMDRTAEGCDTKDKHRLMSPGGATSHNNTSKDMVFKKPAAVWKFQPERTSSHNSNKVSLSSDTMRTYETEGTPINFSTATSLSDLTIESLEDREQGVGRSAPTTADDSPQHSPSDQNSNIATYGTSHDDSVFAQTQSFDSPHVFGVEGTPITFSRNDSLSSLSCDEDNEHDQGKGKTKAKAVPRGGLTPPVRKIAGVNSPKGKASKSSADSKSGIPSPRVKALAMSGKSHPSPSSKQHSAHHKSGQSVLSRSLDDQPQMYAVEGTPMCFSRNSSLSSLNSDDHEGLANQGASGDATLENTVLEEQQANFKVEGTPVCFSRDSPLSALSVESLSSDYEPTPSEKAMLEECINLAMPKRKTPKSVEKSSGKSQKTPRVSHSKVAAVNGQNPSSPNVSPENESRHRSSVKYDPPDHGGGDRSQELRERRKHKTTHPKNVLSKAGDSSQPKTNVPSLQSVCEESSRSPDDSLNCFLPSPLEGATAFDHSELQESCSSETPMNVKRGKDESNQEKSSARSAFPADGAAYSPNDDSDLDEAMQCACGPADENPEFEHQSDNRTDDNKLQDEVTVDSDDDDVAYDSSLIQVAAQSLVTCDQLVSVEAVRGVPSLELPEYDDTEKVDSTKSERSDLDTEIENDINLSLESGIERLDDSDSESEIIDITKETFPEMSYSLDTLSTPEDENLPELKDSDIEILDILECVQEEEQNTSPDSDDKDAFSTPEKASVASDKQESVPEWSPEVERALEENANIVLSELSFKRELSSSTLDEDVSLIENECISLVSNDYTSDTASEISVSLSHSSKTLSEQTEVSSSTLSCTSSAPSMNRPRIVKPINKDAVKLQKEKEAPKPVRGGKKKSSVRSLSSFSSGKSVESSPKSVSMSSKSVTPVKNMNQKNVTPVKKISQKVTPTSKVTGAKTVSPNNVQKPVLNKAGVSSKLSSTQKSPSQTPLSKTANQNGSSKPASPKGSPKPVRNTRIGIATKTTIPKSNISSKTTASSKLNSLAAKSQNTTNSPKSSSSVSPNQKSGASKSKLPTSSNSPIAKATVQPTVSQDDEIERPKPPIKQGTFTKESPSASAPPVVANAEDLDSEVGSLCDVVNDKVYVNGGHVRLREKRRSGGSTSPHQRQSGHSMSPARNSGGTPPQRNSGSSQDSTWTKALESFQFVVDRSSDGGVAPVEETKITKRRKNTPPPVPERRTSLIKTNTNTVGSAVKVDGKTQIVTEQSSKIPNNKVNSDLTKTSKTSPNSMGTKVSESPRNVSSLSKSSPKTSTSSLPGKTTSLNKTSSNSSLQAKTSANNSSSSLNKTASGSSIASGQKSGSNSSLKTPTGKVNMKKSDSSASLKKVSRPSTPNGRPPTPSRKSSLTPTKQASSLTTTKQVSSPKSEANSPSSVGTKKNSPSGKKPVVSKIASLWKKDDGTAEKSPTSRSASPSSSNRNEARKPPLKTQSIPKTQRKNSAGGTPSKASSDRKQSSGSESASSPSPKEGLSKSSTYDKLTVDQDLTLAAQPVSSTSSSASDYKTNSQCVPEPTEAYHHTADDVKAVTKSDASRPISAERKSPPRSNLWRRSPQKQLASTESVVQSGSSNSSISSVNNDSSVETLTATRSQSSSCKSLSPPSKTGQFRADSSTDAVWVKRDGTTSPATPPSVSPAVSPRNSMIASTTPTKIPSPGQASVQQARPQHGHMTVQQSKQVGQGQQQVIMTKMTPPGGKQQKQQQATATKADSPPRQAGQHQKKASGIPQQPNKTQVANGNALQPAKSSPRQANSTLPTTNGDVPKVKKDTTQNNASSVSKANNKVEAKNQHNSSPLSSPSTDIRLASPGTNAAIVAPFNYTPTTNNSLKNNTTAISTNNQSEVQLKNTVNQSQKSSSIPSPNKPMTKTEMLIARRRRSYLNSLKTEEAGESEDGKRPCLVTTV